MKAIFIQNYDVTEAIASRVTSFESWSIEKRPGDGIISPVSVIKSADGNSVLITYDRTSESTNEKAPFDAKLDDEMANNWFNDMRSKDTVEVFKELGGGLIMYVDNSKSEAAIETFIMKMNSVNGIDNVALEAIRPLVNNEANWRRYIDMVPSYEELMKNVSGHTNEFESVRLESVEPEPSYDSSDSDPDSVDVDGDYTDDLESTDLYTPIDSPQSEPVSYDMPAELNDEVIDDLSVDEHINENTDTLENADNDDIPVENTPVEEPSVPTQTDTSVVGLSTSEINLVKELAAYLEENNTTLIEMLSSISKLKLVVNKLYQDNSKVEPVSTPVDTTITEDLPEEPKESSISAFTQAVMDTAQSMEPEPVSVTQLEEPDELPKVEETDLNENSETNDTPVVNDDVIETDNESNLDSNYHTSIDNDAVLMESALKNSNNDDEFFKYLIPHKDKLTNESINKLVNIKMYDYLLTGVEFQNLISVRQDRAEKLGLI